MWTTEFLTQAGAFAVVGALVILAMLVGDRDNSTRFFWQVIFSVCIGCCVVASIWLAEVTR